VASFVTKTVLVGLVAALITAVCAATPARAATGKLVVTLQDALAHPIGSKTLEWNGDTTCLTLTLPTNVNQASAKNNTDQSIAVYSGSGCQGTILNYIGVGGTSNIGLAPAFSFQPNG
jgi:hypothetical protein